VIRRRGARGASAFAALLVLAVALSSAPAARAEVRLQPADPTAQGPYVPPGAGANLAAPSEPRKEPITRKWWFWTAVGAVVATTVVVILVANQDPSPPKSVLGNMDAFMGK
jgi:hypothetical protein